MIGKVSIDLIAPHHSNKGKTLLEKHDVVTEPKAQSSLWSRVTRTRGRKIALAATAALSVIGLTAGTVSALTTTQAANGVSKQAWATNNIASTAIGTSWTYAPGMAASVTTSGYTVLSADYTAETQCLGTAPSYCSARIGYIKAGTSTFVPMSPNESMDFALDSPGGDGSANGSWEGRGMGRVSARVPAGTYRVYVQVAKVGSGVTQYRVDEQFLHVTANAA